MKIADLNVTKEWKSLNELLGDEKLKGVDSLKVYHLQNTLSFPIYYVEAETKPSIDELGAVLLGGACAKYAVTEGKELFLCHHLAGHIGEPKELPVILHDNSPIHNCVALGSYEPEVSEDNDYITKEQAQIEFSKKADKSELELKANKSDLEQKANKSELELKANKSELKAKPDAVINNADGIARLFNETSGGGAQFDNTKKNTLSFVGVNNGNDGVFVQIYSKDKKTNAGARLNVSPAGIYYTNGKTNASYDASNEVAIKANLSDKADSLSLEALVSRLSLLEDKVSNMAKANVEPIIAEKGQALPEMKDETKDYSISGTVSKSATVTGKSVTLNNATITDGARLTVVASDVELKSATIQGDFPKATSNAIMVVNDAEHISVKDTVVNATTYNCLEIGTAQIMPKSVLIENCQFKGTFANNAIIVFGTQDNATININNCYFENVSNILRLSNRTNAKNVVVNITNCVCDKWDASEYAGAILLQDYVSKTAQEVANNNFFGDGKITINISNLITPNGKLVKPSNLAEICGSKTDKQVIYIYDSVNSVRAYNETIYPNVNIN